MVYYGTYLSRNIWKLYWVIYYRCISYFARIIRRTNDLLGMRYRYLDIRIRFCFVHSIYDTAWKGQKMNSKEEAAEVLRFKIIQIKNQERRLVFDHAAFNIIRGIAHDALTYLNSFIDETSYYILLNSDPYRYSLDEWINHEIVTLESCKTYVEILIEAFELMLDDLLAN